MTFRKLWQYCHTHTFCPGDKIRHKKTTALLLTFQNCFFFFSKNAQHLPLNYLYSATVRVKYHVIYKLI